MSENTKKNPAFLELLKRSALVQNPVLVQLVGLCPVVPAAASLKSAALFAGVYLLVLMVTQLLASLLLRKLPRYIRVCCYLVIGLAIVLPVIAYIEQYDQTILAGIGIYFPLLAINSITALHCEKVAVQSSLKVSCQDALATGLGYAVVLLLVGALRELFGSGTLWGMNVMPQAMPRMSAMLLPFGGFLMLGFLAAILRAALHRKDPEQMKQAALRVSRTEVKLREEPLPKREKPTVYDPQQALPPEEEAAGTAEAAGDAAAAPVSAPEQPAKEETPLRADMDAITQQFQDLMRDLEQKYPGQDPDAQ